MNTVKRLLSYMKPYWRQFSTGFIAILLVTGVNLSMPYIFGRSLIDRIFSKGGQFTQLNLLAFGIVVMFFFKEIFVYAKNYLMSYVGYRVVTDLRYQIYDRLQMLSIGYHESHRTGELISRITYDVGLVQTSVSITLADLFTNAFLLVGTIVMLFVINWRLALLTMVVFPLGALVVSRASNQIRVISHRVQEKIADLTSVLQESLIGIKVVKAFTMEEHEKRRFSGENEAGFNATMKSVQAISLLTPVMELLFITASAFVIWYGGTEVLKKTISTGEFIAFFGYLAMATTPLTTLTVHFNQLLQALTASERIFSLLDQDEEIKDRPDAISLSKISGQVEFRNVSFCYRNAQPVLSNINFQVKPGEIIALVGPSGSGKTSLVNLLLRFYDPVKGQILIDNHDLRDIRIKDFRNQIGLVPQESILFGITIRENIAYGRPEAALEDIIYAAKAANAHDFICSLPDGYETMVSERGASLSGGQKQRLSLARAILRNPRILILDEATSALDTESERLVQEALETLMRDRTTFVIAHRLSTIQHAHKIFVLAEGTIIEQGTHEELLAKEGLYRKLYESGLDYTKGKSWMDGKEVGVAK